MLHDQNGNLIYFGTQCNSAPNTTIFDLSQNETIQLWLETIKYAMAAQDGVVDGVFVDQGSFNIAGLKQCVNITQQKMDQIISDHIRMPKHLVVGVDGGG